MNITNDREVMIFRNEWQDKVIYNVGLSKKLQDGNYENGTIMCQFKNGVDLPNQTKITIKSAWLSFYKNKDNHTVPYIFINEFVGGQAPELSQAEITKPTMNEESDPFQDFGKSHEEDINSLELPF